MKLTPLPANGRCCEETLTLAEDFTRFTVVEFADGKWTLLGGGSEDPTGAEDSIRLFCPTCGTYYQVPDEL